MFLCALLADKIRNNGCRTKNDGNFIHNQKKILNSTRAGQLLEKVSKQDSNRLSFHKSHK